MNGWKNGVERLPHGIPVELAREERSIRPSRRSSLAWVASFAVALFASSGCEISVDSSSTSNGAGESSDRGSSDSGSTDVARVDRPVGSSEGADAIPSAGSENAASSKSSQSQADSESPGTTPDMPAGTPSKSAAPSKNDSPEAEGPVVDPLRPTPQGGNSQPVESTPDAPSPQLAPSSPAGAKPKKELLPIESTARRALAREAGVEVITFDDLNLGMQADMVFRDFLLNDRARELDGQKVRLIGYMFGGVSQLKDLREFILLRNTECKFGPGGLADHLVRVFMKSEPGADYSTSAMQIEGVLKVNPYQGPDGNTWSVYDIEAQSVKVIKK